LQNVNDQAFPMSTLNKFV